MGEEELPRPSQARFEQTEAGLRAADDGWFTLNLAEAVWGSVESEGHGSCTEFEPEDETPGFAQLGFNVKVFGPGEPSTNHHRETGQEGYLVLAGEATLVIDGERLSIGPWDYVHIPADTPHSLVGAGETRCAVMMLGRRPVETVYIPEPLAAELGASVSEVTGEGGGAYSEWPPWNEVSCDPDWLPTATGARFESRAGAERPANEGVALEPTDAGLVPSASDRWFVLNLADAPWAQADGAGQSSELQPADRALEFEGFGFNVHVIGPGEPNGLYHREAGQEAFLVLDGECDLVVEGERRRLGPWDFFHCPPGTNHIVVGAGDGPCAVAMAGSRPDDPIVYPVEPAAIELGAGLEREATAEEDPYADWPETRTVPYAGWLPELVLRR
ncbi:cupin domain-containing protein [Thermoleophilia bacterium SCSIO 60948]|nr:cupin domain-containing protein [Thermoleophilia bacterium SCSIO 60948]